MLVVSGTMPHPAAASQRETRVLELDSLDRLVEAALEIEILGYRAELEAGRQLRLVTDAPPLAILRALNA